MTTHAFRPTANRPTDNLVTTRRIAIVCCAEPEIGDTVTG